MNLPRNEAWELNGKKLLALDLGTKYTGVAVFCPGDDLFPIPQDTIITKNKDKLLEKIKEIVAREQVCALILGVPYSLDEKETIMARKNKGLGKVLQANFPHLAVYYQDEALSSWEAEERMKKSPLYNFRVHKEKIHSLAACIILEDFLLARQK
ncbi:MAG: Holliday junction resolvase RuvX [Halobacteriovoraceae bacterium]|nr:Holliday junction resolvase RuvX [Halobacteriovoraceae bacterium]